MDPKFHVGDAVMFFIGRDGVLAEPPEFDTVTDKILYETPCGTIVSAGNGMVTIRTDEGELISLTAGQLRKVWFLSGPTKPAKTPKSSIFFGFTMPKNPSAISNIRPFGDA
jgi:hypothetical protein